MISASAAAGTGSFSRLHPVRSWIRVQLRLLIFTIIVTVVCRLVAIQTFDTVVSSTYWYRDFAGNWLVAIVIYLLTQSVVRTMLATSIIVGFFQLANSAKLAVLGTPASPDDFFNFQNLFFLADGWHRWMMYAIAASLIGLVLACIAWRRRRTWLVIALLAGVGVAIAENSEPLRAYLDSRYGNSVWNQPANYQTRGLALHLAQETIRTIAKTGEVPDRVTVERVLSAHPFSIRKETQLETLLQKHEASTGTSPSTTGAQRNLHLMVLESFFDPLTLGPEWVPEDPFPESLRELWSQAGHSRIMSPVFGGYTANAEFEVLCGFPVTRNAVFFEGWLRNEVPCLPALLSATNYQTVASHPNVAGFWNRTHAYQLLGFDEYLSKSDFDLEQAVEGILPDGSFYQQVFDWLEHNNKDAPVFNYMLTYYGHLPYHGSERFPDRVSAGKDSELLHGYLNQMWYKSRDLMQRLAELRQSDPESLIVVFGDHLPFLGQNYGVYTEAWQLPDDRGEFTGDHLQKLTTTPLIIIDGQRGPVPVGTLPLYRLPSVILSLLGIEHDTELFRLTRNPDSSWIRPVYGTHFYTDSVVAKACAPSNPPQAACSSTSRWLEHIELLIQDIFTGKQHTLASERL